MISPAPPGQLRRSAWLGIPLLAGAIQVGGSFAAADGQPARKSIDAVAVGILLIGPLGLFAMRRSPHVSLVLAGSAAALFIALGYPFGPIFCSLAVALFVAVQSIRRRTVLMMSAVVVVGFLVAVTVDPRNDGDLPFHILIVIGWLTAVAAISEVVRSRREQFAERRQAAIVAGERRLSDERVRLAQELHDVLAHNISLINVQSSVALHLIEQQPEVAVSALTNVKRASAEALDELRVALDVLRGGDTPRAPAPRLAELDQLIDGVRAGGLRIDSSVDPLPPDLPAGVELAAYRIVQEALTNVNRHSNARSVAVMLTTESNVLRVEVVDDGTGATAPSGSAGRGLSGMRERAVAQGGSFDAAPTAAGGFRVVASLPWAS